MKIVKTIQGQCLAALLISPLLLSGQQDQSLDFITDSTDVRYRYEMIQEQNAQLPDPSAIDKVDLEELELMKPSRQHQIISEGVNSAQEHYLQIENLFNTTLEEWMSVPRFQLVTPTASYGFDSLGQSVYHFPHNVAERENQEDFHQFLQSEGFAPIMLFFPSKHDDFVQEAVVNGAVFKALPDNAFELNTPEQEWLFEPKLKRITNRYNLDSNTIENQTTYTLYAPYGYVPVFEKETSVRQDLPFPVTFITRTNYSNHVIEDLNGSIPRYTDEAHLEVFPNPVQSSFEVLFRGIPEAQVSKVEIRNHLGHLLQTVSMPVVHENIMSLDASSYPSGPLILLVHTQHGIYSKNISKI